MRIEFAPDLRDMADNIIQKLDLEHIDPKRITYFRSYGSTANASARIWALPRIWQKALSIDARYIIEAICPYFDKQKQEEQEKIIIHELLHVPKKFTGGIVPHICFGKKIDNRRVNALHKQYRRRQQEADSYLQKTYKGPGSG